MKKTRTMTGILLIAGMLFCSGCGYTSKAIAQEKEAGIQAMKQEKYEEAIGHFDKSMELAGGSIDEGVIDTCFYKAAAQYNLGKVEEAIKQYSAIIKYDENNGDACFLRGSIYLKEGDLKKALEDYGAAIERDAKDYGMYIAIYRNLSAYGYEEEGRTFLNQALDIKGKGKDTYLGRGRIYLELGEYEKAEKQLEKVGDDASEETLALMADLEMEAKNYEKALSYYQKALEKKHPTDIQRLLKGEIAALEYTGQFEKAKEKVDAYLEQYPEDAMVQKEKIFLQTR